MQCTEVPGYYRVVLHDIRVGCVADEDELAMGEGLEESVEEEAADGERCAHIGEVDAMLRTWLRISILYARESENHKPVASLVYCLHDGRRLQASFSWSGQCQHLDSRPTLLQVLKGLQNGILRDHRGGLGTHVTDCSATHGHRGIACRATVAVVAFVAREMVRPRERRVAVCTFVWPSVAVDRSEVTVHFVREPKRSTAYLAQMNTRISRLRLAMLATSLGHPGAAARFRCYGFRNRAGVGGLLGDVLSELLSELLGEVLGELIGRFNLLSMLVMNAQLLEYQFVIL